MVPDTGVLERGLRPVQPAQPEVQRGVAVADRAEVALEVVEVDGVEADLRAAPCVSCGFSLVWGASACAYEGHEEAHVDLGERVADDVGPAGEHLLETVERVEEG